MDIKSGGVKHENDYIVIYDGGHNITLKIFCYRFSAKRYTKAINLCVECNQDIDNKYSSLQTWFPLNQDLLPK